MGLRYEGGVATTTLLLSSCYPAKAAMAVLAGTVDECPALAGGDFAFGQVAGKGQRRQAGFDSAVDDGAAFARWAVDVDAGFGIEDRENRA